MMVGFTPIFGALRRKTHANAIVDDCLWDVAVMDDDMLGLDHPDRSLNRRNGLGDLFLR